MFRRISSSLVAFVLPVAGLVGSIPSDAVAAPHGPVCIAPVGPGCVPSPPVTGGSTTVCYGTNMSGLAVQLGYGPYGVARIGRSAVFVNGVMGSGGAFGQVYTLYRVDMYGRQIFVDQTDRFGDRRVSAEASNLTFNGIPWVVVDASGAVVDSNIRR